MSWRTVVISHRCKLDYKLGYMNVRDEETHKVFLDEVGLLLIESTAVSLTTYLLKELAERKIKVLFCDETNNPISELSLLYGSHDTSNKIREQIAWNDNSKDIAWTYIIREKILNQAKVLSWFNEKEKAGMLINYANEVQLADSTNREGHSAKVYFNALFGNNFSRGQDIAINYALNYGYGILLSLFNKEIVSNGYLTQLGIGHRNTFNQFNLSCDLMEPFRPLIDKIVRQKQYKEFDRVAKHDILGIFNQTFIIDDRQQYLPNAISIYCKSVFNAITSDGKEPLKFCEVARGEL